MSFLDTLDPKYRLILCDIWGVVHDGVDALFRRGDAAYVVAERGPLRSADY